MASKKNRYGQDTKDIKPGTQVKRVDAVTHDIRGDKKSHAQRLANNAAVKGNKKLSWDHYKKQYARRIAGGKIGGGADKDKNKEAWNKAKMAFYKYRRYNGKPVYGAGKGQNPNMPDSGMRHVPAPPGAMEKARKRQKDLAAYKERTK